jgi:hypothetical protein
VKRVKCGRCLFFANRGEFRSGDDEEIVNKASCLSLLSNAVLLWNTLRIADIVNQLRHLKLFVEYYHGTRTHLSPEKDTSASRYTAAGVGACGSGDAGWRAASSVRTSRRLNPHDVEWSHSNKLLYCGFIEGRFSDVPRGSRRHKLLGDNNVSSVEVGPLRITAPLTTAQAECAGSENRVVL